MPILYGTYRSRATRNIWLALEAGIELEMRQVMQAYRLDDPAAADAPLNTLSPAFLALSPAGAIPVLQDGNLVLSESLAINLYLARQHGGALGPADAAEDALMLQWALYGATSIETPALAIAMVHTEKRENTPEGQAELGRSRAALGRPFRVLDAHLAANPQMVGARFTVADINMAEIVRYASADAGLMASYPHVQAWLAACQARPAFQQMWARRLAEPV